MPRRPMTGARPMWLAVLVGAAGLLVWSALVLAMVLSTLPAADRAQVVTWLAPRWPLWALGWLIGSGGVLLGIRTLWARHVQPLAPLGEQVRAWASTPSPQPLPTQSTPSLNTLADACNALLAQRQVADAELQAKVAEVSAQLTSERNRLASLLAQSSQSMVVCNLDGLILLYNPRARLQLRTLSKAPQLASGTDVVGIGRSIYGVLQEAQVQHALNRVRHQLRRGAAQAAAQFVTTTHSGRLLRVQLAAVLDSAVGAPEPQCSGFMLTLDDMTRAYDTAADRDRLLGEVAERISAGVQRVQWAATEGQQADDARRARALTTIQGECSDLRDQSAALMRQAAAGMSTRWPLEDMLVADWLVAAERRLTEGERRRIAVDPVPDGLWVRVDSYLLLEAMAMLADQLSDAFAPRYLGLRATVSEEGDAAHLDLYWDGQSFSTETVMTWELEAVGTGEAHGMLTLRDVLGRHHGELAFGRDRLRNQSFLRFVLPLVSADRADAALTDDAQPLAPADGRPEFYDFDLFQTRPFQGAHDDEPLTALTYTVFDTETTGLNPSQGDQLIQIGATRIVNGRLLRSESFEQLIDPGRTLSTANIAIHGISNEALQGQPPVAEVLPVFHAFAQGTVLVAHNAAFDMKFLQLQEKATGLVFDQPVLDTLLLAVAAQPQQDSHRLEALTERFGITVTGRHTALADATATAEVLLHLIPLLQAQGIRTLGQARAAAQQTYLARLKY
ncbi:exonuclease domain-containing protein [Ottowia sp.]|uniref:3'-5' exonuclease n=1 Tax=Ottowia sp. TaxID=1898956 RepID=UPI003A844E09